MHTRESHICRLQTLSPITTVCHSPTTNRTRALIQLGVLFLLLLQSFLLNQIVMQATDWTVLAAAIPWPTVAIILIGR